MYAGFSKLQQLKGVGPTLGGPGMGLPAWLIGYPEDLRIADVEKIVHNKLTVRQMVTKFPVDTNFWSARG